MQKDIKNLFEGFWIALPGVAFLNMALLSGAHCIIISFSPLMIMLDYAADIKLFYECHLTGLTFIF